MLFSLSKPKLFKRWFSTPLILILPVACKLISLNWPVSWSGLLFKKSFFPPNKHIVNTTSLVPVDNTSVDKRTWIKTWKESIKASKIRPVCWVFRTVLTWKLWNNYIFWFLLAGLDSTHDLPYKINALMRSVTYGSRGFSAQPCGSTLTHRELSLDALYCGWGATIIFCQTLCYLLSLLHRSYHTKSDILLWAKAVRMMYEMASRQ